MVLDSGDDAEQRARNVRQKRSTISMRATNSELGCSTRIERDRTVLDLDDRLGVDSHREWPFNPSYVLAGLLRRTSG